MQVKIRQSSFWQSFCSSLFAKVFYCTVLDKYLQVLPAEAKKNDVFYLKPLVSVPSHPNAPWFLNVHVPVGKNKLNVMVKEMCGEARIIGYFMNHNLHAYGATTLFKLVYLKN